MSKLLSAILRIIMVFESIFQSVYGTGSRLMRFIKNNPQVVAAIATVVIAIYAFLTFGVQEKLRVLQSNIIAMQTEPKLTGAIGSWFKRHEPKYEYYYEVTNIGSDTAWSVFPKGQALILCDSMLIYPETYLFGYMYSCGVRPGEFSRRFPVAPTETKDWGFVSTVGEDFAQLSNMLAGIILLEVHIFYWSDSPSKRYWEKEYFIYNKLSYDPAGSYFEKLLDPNDRILRQFNSLQAERKTARLTYYPLFNQNRMLILSNSIPSSNLTLFHWTFRDTSIVLDSTIMDFSEYRRRFKEFQ